MGVIADLQRQKRTVQTRIDELRAINPYYPISNLSGQISKINKKIERIRQTRNDGLAYVRTEWITENILDTMDQTQK